MADALRLRVRPELEAPVLVLAFEGWNDAGDAASSAVRFLWQSLSAVPLGAIDGEPFFDFTVERPELSVRADGTRGLEWPGLELGFVALESGPDLVLGVGPEPHLRWRHFADLTARLAAEIGARSALLLGAYQAEVLYSLPVQVSGFATRPERLGRLGVESSHYDGPTGIVAVLAERLERAGLDVLSLWAGLPHYIAVTPNPRGALALVQLVSRALPLPMDETPLCAAAAEFEERVAELVSGDPELSEYVRELKRRGFAQ